MKSALLLFALACAASTAHAQFTTCVPDSGDLFYIGGILYQTDDVCYPTYPPATGGWFPQCDTYAYSVYYVMDLIAGYLDPEWFAEQYGCFPYFRSDHPHHKYTNAFAEALFLPKLE